nr:class I SAM-dependent methyltransferase [uncultured Rhodopila sp.]
MSGAARHDAGFVNDPASSRDSMKPEGFWRSSAPSGVDYVTILANLHNTLKPKSYFEIGVLAGTTLALATCPSVGVDPVLEIKKPVLANKPFCCCFRKTSDQFFEDHNPTEILGRPIDFAFLDGMHWFEYLLRDFINTERHCRKNSVICLHDCLPVDAYVGRRDMFDKRWESDTHLPGGWAGDVWKVVLILRKYRPDIKMHIVDASPTGLAAITSLDPASEILADRYFDLVAEFRHLTLQDNGSEYLEYLNIIPASDLMSGDAISQMFWL